MKKGSLYLKQIMQAMVFMVCLRYNDPHGLHGLLKI